MSGSTEQIDRDVEPTLRGIEQIGRSLESLGGGIGRADTGVELIQRDGELIPVVDGIEYRRGGREDLRRKVITAVVAGNRHAALRLLLNDRDDFDSMPPALTASIDAVINHVDSGASGGLHRCMLRLNYGGVADYFAIRPSSPTFLSGLELVARGMAGRPTGVRTKLVDLGCGIGQLAAWVHAADGFTDVIGIDTVFSKLWLARHYFLPHQRLICADINLQTLDDLNGSDACVLCHDAFYFFENKSHVLEVAKNIAGPNGGVAIGHVHHQQTDRHGVGNVWSLAEYEALFRRHFDSPAFVSDDSLTGSAHDGTAIVWRNSLVAMRSCEAFSMLGEPADGGLAFDPIAIDGNWKLNPIRITGRDDSVRIDWPSDAIAREYADARYLLHIVDDGEIDAPQRRRLRHELPARFLSPVNRSPGTVIRDRPIRWAIVGCGWVARDHAVDGILLTPGHEILLCVDPSENARRRMAAKLSETKLSETLVSEASGGRTAVPRMSATISKHEFGDVDAVYVATPNHTHADVVLQLAAAGVPVLCEKPLSINGNDAQTMLAACRSARVPLVIAMDQRHHPAHRMMAGMIRDGAIGTVTQIRIHYACWLPLDWSPDGQPHDNWRVDQNRSGGGAVIDLAPHGIDLCCYLTDQNVARIHTMLQRRIHDDYRCDDGGIVSLQLGDGTLASIAVSYACNDRVPRRLLDVIGTRGTLHAENTMGQTAGGTVTLHRDDGSSEPVEFDRDSGPFQNQMEHFGDLLDRRDLHSIFKTTRAQIDAHQRLLKSLEQEIVLRGTGSS